ALQQISKDNMENELAQHPLVLHHDNQVVAIEKPHVFRNKNVEFAIALFLLGFIGIFRKENSLYFRNVWVAFGSNTFSKRQLKDQLEQNQKAALLLNIFFCVSVALYIFIVLKYFNMQDWWVSSYA